MPLKGNGQILEENSIVVRSHVVHVQFPDFRGRLPQNSRCKWVAPGSGSLVVSCAPWVIWWATASTILILVRLAQILVQVPFWPGESQKCCNCLLIILMFLCHLHLWMHKLLISTSPCSWHFYVHKIREDMDTRSRERAGKSGNSRQAGGGNKLAGIPHVVHLLAISSVCCLPFHLPAPSSLFFWKHGAGLCPLLSPKIVTAEPLYIKWQQSRSRRQRCQSSDAHWDGDIWWEYMGCAL